MGHEITTKDNVVLMRNLSAWHKLGVVLPGDGLTAVEAVGHALDWRVSLQPVRCSHPDFAGLDVPARAVVRMDTMDVLGVVGDRYHALQNIDLALAIDAATGDQPLVDVAGSLAGGRLVWVLLNLEGSGAGDWTSGFAVQGRDVVHHYVVVMTGHDGRTPVRVFSTSVRVVCKNTWNMALGANALHLKVRHTGTVVERTGVATEAVLALRGSLDEQRNLYRAMAEMRLDSPEAQVEFVLRHLGLDPKAQSTKMKNKIAAARTCLELERAYAEQVDGDPLSLWTAYNGVTNYATHADGATRNGAAGRMVAATTGALATKVDGATKAARKLVTAAGLLATA